MIKFNKDGKSFSRSELKKEHPNVCFPRDPDKIRSWAKLNGYKVEKVKENTAKSENPSLTADDEKHLIIQAIMVKQAEEAYEKMTKQERKALLK